MNVDRKQINKKFRKLLYVAGMSADEVNSIWREQGIRNIQQKKDTGELVVQAARIPSIIVPGIIWIPAS